MNGLEMLLANMGVNAETYLLLVTFLSSLIFMSKDMRIGLVFLLLLLSSEFLILFNMGRDTTYHMYAIFITLIAMALSLFISYSKTTVI